MKNISTATDDAILKQLGLRIQQRRLDLQLTQAEVSEQAGISKRTVERIESGASTQTVSLIRLLRVLALLQGLEQLVPAATPRPMDLLRLQGKARKRVSSRRHKDRSTGNWSWEDDQ